MEQKDKVLMQAREHVKATCQKICTSEEKTKALLEKSKANFNKLSEEAKIVEVKLIKQNEKRVSELDFSKNSPYFVRLDVIFAGDSKTTTMYFGKYSFDSESIYSWVAPASTLRFEKPGKSYYLCPDGNFQEVDLLRKDQCLIANGEIKFLATESVDSPRELVYQEHFSNRKTGFVLPEIIAKMEKAQDLVIRAHHVGPFLISGPAGSGKTTLALHRVAYLLQSPDLAETYKENTIIVFVQDNGTKQYFSGLLPDLGIKNVLITTFSEWAFSILDIDANFVARCGNSENDRDLYEYAKLNALRQGELSALNKAAPFSQLEKFYLPYMTASQLKIFDQQKKDNVLDRIDLTVLLSACRKANQNLGKIKDYWIEQKNGIWKKKHGFVPLDYSLAVVDEFQNYLPEQLKLMKSCLNNSSRSIIYVGDMAQEVQLGTIKSFDQIGEQIETERKVILEKVYRNTKNILGYIKNLGYKIEIPDSLKEGPTVKEMFFSDLNSELQYIQEILEESDFGSAGILLKDDSSIQFFKNAFSGNEKIHVMTMNEAQGVEFDIVFIANVNREMFEIDYKDGSPKELMAEKEQINKDLLYVALTRAINEMHVTGRAKLSEVLH